MTVYEYVARSLGVDTGIMTSGATVGTIVGGDDALDTSDGDTSYVMVSEDAGVLGSPKTQIPFRWEPVGAHAPLASVTSMTVTAELRKDDAATNPNGWVIFGTGGSALLTLIAPSGTTYGLDADNPISTFYASAVIDGDPFLLASFVPGFTLYAATRITYLRLFMEAGTPYLRQRNRGRVRSRLRADRQRSIRSRGFL